MLNTFVSCKQLKLLTIISPKSSSDFLAVKEVPLTIEIKMGAEDKYEQGQYPLLCF